jgi:hypothetical protein
MTWYRYETQWRTCHPDESLQCGDWYIYRIGSRYYLRLIQVNGIADYGWHTNLTTAQEYAERQPKYIAS